MNRTLTDVTVIVCIVVRRIVFMMIDEVTKKDKMVRSSASRREYRLIISEIAD